MTDGITLGRPRCAIDTCREDLAKNRDIFCPTHFGHHFKCAVRVCTEPATVGKMCANPQHQKMESLKKARSDAPFQLAKRMQRMRVSHPNDALLSEDAIFDNHDVTDDLEGNIEWFELEGETEEDVRMYNEANPGGIGEEDAGEFLEGICTSRMATSSNFPHQNPLLTAPSGLQQSRGARPTCLEVEHITSRRWFVHAVSCLDMLHFTMRKLYLTFWYVPILYMILATDSHPGSHRESDVCPSSSQARAHHL
jgi:hypothetical protein